MNHSTPGLPVQHLLPEFTQTHVHRVSDTIHHLIFCRPLLLLPPIPPSIRVFSNESALRMRWPKYWSFSFSIIPSKEIPWLISFRMDWLDLLSVQGTLKSLLQHHSSKASILQRSAFFTVQLLHPYMTTGKTITLPRQNFVDKVMSLLLNMPSRLVITFLPSPANHDGVITHLEADILECEVKWALGSITVNKASGGDGVQVEHFQILEMMLLNCCT